MGNWNGVWWFWGLVDKLSELSVLGDKVMGLFGSNAKEEITSAMTSIDKDALVYRHTIQTNTRLIEDLRKRTYRTRSNIFKKLWAKAKIKLWLKDEEIGEITRLQKEIDDARLVLNSITEDNQEETRASTAVKLGEAARGNPKNINIQTQINLLDATTRGLIADKAIILQDTNYMSDPTKVARVAAIDKQVRLNTNAMTRLLRMMV